MGRQCLICESKAVITCEAAKGLALLLGLLDVTCTRPKARFGEG